MCDQLDDFTPICKEALYTLAECFAAQNCDTQGEEDDSDSIAQETAEIAEDFRRVVYLCNEEQLAFLQFAAELTETKAVWEKDAKYPSFFTFYFYDFVYLFQNGDGYHLVLPLELIKILREVIEEPDFAAVNARNLEYKYYAIAMLGLYGAYECSHFVAVWNQHHKEKINLEEAEAFFISLNSFTVDLYLDDEFVVYECLQLDELDELIEEIYDMPYYMPTKSVIREYDKRKYDYDYVPQEEEEMTAFLSPYFTDLQEEQFILFQIVESCERLRSPKEVYEFLKETNLPLQDREFVEKFNHLYNKMRENTHIWDLRGFTPSQYQAETDGSILYFRLPERMRKK